MLQLTALLFLVVLAAAYWLYGRWVAQQLDLSASTETPAHKFRDGIDFVPTKPFYLFGQHFSAIAAAGPIAGPIVACSLFGWLPCLLWILVGVVLIGAVHDITSLAASVKHGAQSIAEVARKQLSSRAGRAMMAFIWLTLIYVIVAFADITAGSFVSKSEELAGVQVQFNPGGAVAAASIFYLALSIILGLVQRFLKPPQWLITVVFVPLIFVAVWLGTSYSTLFLFDIKTWGVIIVTYCALGSVLPVWLLLQPRGFLGGFVLYLAIAVGIMGIFFGDYEIKQPAFTKFDLGTATGVLFPFLFVTIACGACSGFHGLVCSGTTSKQLDKETHSHAIGYGAMLAEAFVAFIALSTIMIISVDQAKGLRPGTIYGNGIGEFLTLLIGKENLPFAITLGAMAFSTFVFDTLDVGARLGRYLIQELLGLPNLLGATIGTILTLGIPILVIVSTQEGGWIKFWTLFGAANQLLAALTLLTISIWLRQSGKRIAFTLIPMIFILCITFTALVYIVKNGLVAANGIDGNLINAIVSGLLILLALFICFEAVYRRKFSIPIRPT
jgi:carbon starvation protein